MANVELVIKIPEEIYKASQIIDVNRNDCIQIPLEVIANGIVLPKGHGALKDELDLDLFAPSLGTSEYVCDLMAKHNIDYLNSDDEDKVRAFARDLIHCCMNVIKTAPTIIEAESEKKEK